MIQIANIDFFATILCSDKNLSRSTHAVKGSSADFGKYFLAPQLCRINNSCYGGMTFLRVFLFTPPRVCSRMVAAKVRRRILARKTLPPSRRASVSASLRRDRAEARGEGGKAPLRRDGGPPRHLGGYGLCDDS